MVDADVVDANAVLADAGVVSHAAGQQIDVVVVIIVSLTLMLKLFK